jgi:hypothetical protein
MPRPSRRAFRFESLILQWRGMTLFEDHRLLPPETIRLASGPVEVQRFSWRFPQWRGEPIRKTHGNKPVLDCGGSPAFAELALIPVLRQSGFDGAVWIDNWQGCHFRDALPGAPCAILPAPAQEVYNRILAANGKPGGCWDVLAWDRDGITFIECKWKDNDSITPKQRKWLESARKVGVRPEQFAICEWVLD